MLGRGRQLLIDTVSFCCHSSISQLITCLLHPVDEVSWAEITAGRRNAAPAGCCWVQGCRQGGAQLGLVAVLALSSQHGLVSVLALLESRGISMQASL